MLLLRNLLFESSPLCWTEWSHVCVVLRIHAKSYIYFFFYTNVSFCILFLNLPPAAEAQRVGDVPRGCCVVQRRGKKGKMSPKETQT